MIQLNPEFLKKNGKPEFVALPGWTRTSVPKSGKLAKTRAAAASLNNSYNSFYRQDVYRQDVPGAQHDTRHHQKGERHDQSHDNRHHGQDNLRRHCHCPRHGAGNGSAFVGCLGRGGGCRGFGRGVLLFGGVLCHAVPPEHLVDKHLVDKRNYRNCSAKLLPPWFWQACRILGR
ncbi:hypothetical protein [Leptodesmis sp.]|uniref:hypothetical protein n=1 Tax=Leptodesmis sp. TaxID=3100501 RepID=UPI00405358FE